ncbi:MAG: hypothetical protein H6618_04340 [Deltaproteobacteria bacterium]|nr:hypothetical protein [Deltaproteobacteria bacterium]
MSGFPGACCLLRSGEADSTETPGVSGSPGLVKGQQVPLKTVEAPEQVGSGSDCSGRVLAQLQLREHLGGSDSCSAGESSEILMFRILLFHLLESCSVHNCLP